MWAHINVLFNSASDNRKFWRNSDHYRPGRRSFRSLNLVDWTKGDQRLCSKKKRTFCPGEQAGNSGLSEQTGLVTVSALVPQEIRLEPVEEEVLESKTVSLDWLLISFAEHSVPLCSGTAERSCEGSLADKRHSAVVIETAALLVDSVPLSCPSLLLCLYLQLLVFWVPEPKKQHKVSQF